MENEKKYYIQFIPKGSTEPYWERKGFWCDFMQDPKHVKSYIENVLYRYGNIYEEYVITDRTNYSVGEDEVVIERGPVA